jgi:type I restriction enzyme M protein
MSSHSEYVSFIWGVADLIRDSFRRGHYQDVILPLTVLRRIDLVLAPTKQKVLDTFNKLNGKLDNLHPQLCKASGFAFYNTSKYDFERLTKEPQQLEANLRNYIAGFSDNMREVIEKFDFTNTITKLEAAGLLFKVVERFADKTKLNLSPKSEDNPDGISNHEMGYLFEELVRKFNEALDENPGEHFTPREVIRLMTQLMTFHDLKELKKGKVIRTVYDPCCGSGGMLTIGKEQILKINSEADVHLFGQEVNPQTFAMCKSDLYMKSSDGRDAENISFGSTLSADGHADRTFDYMLANPPYGKDWNLDQDAVRKEAGRASKNRFEAGLPRISDGQLLFLQHMLGRMHTSGEGISRVAIILNGSPLFTGDAGSGESEIRRWILENDYLEALIALPKDLFYNTPISTYIWVLSNSKPADRHGKVLLLRQKTLGSKRRDIPDGVDRPENYLPHILNAFKQFTDTEITIPASDSKTIRCKVFSTAAFGYRKVTIERPLRLNFQASVDRIVRLKESTAFKNLAISRKKDEAERAMDIKIGEATQSLILLALATLPKEIYYDRDQFTTLVEKALKSKTDLKVSVSVRRAILDALSERDPKAPISLDQDGQQEADPSLRDTESVPLDYLDDENVPADRKVHEFFDREVKPHVKDAWINESVRDEKDKEIGIVGYEINFNRYFYLYTPPRSLEEIEQDIKEVERDVLKLLQEVTG